MAYYTNQDDEQDPNAPQQTQTGPSSSGVIGNQGGAATSGNAPTSDTPTSSPTPDNPGNFVGIQQYLDANKSQTGKLGDNVVNKFNSQIDTTDQQIGQIGGQFNTLADQGTITNFNTAGQDAARITQGAAQGTKDQQSANKEADQARFNEVSNAQYNGPNQLIDTELWQPAYQNIKKTDSYVGKDAEQGNRAILADLQPETNYTSGMGSLDNLLLSGSQANKDRLAASRSNASTLQGKFDAQATRASEYAQALKDQTKSIRDQARSGLETTRQDRTAQVESALDSVNQNWRAEYDKFVNLMKNSEGGSNFDLTPAEAARLGVTEGQAIYNTLKGVNADTKNEDLNNYINLETFDANRVISQDEQAQLAALDQLASQYGGTQTNKYTQSSLAGTQNNQDALDTSGFTGAVSNAQAGFDVDKKNKINTSSGGDRGISGNSGSYSGTMNDYLTGNYTKLPPVTKDDWMDIERMFWGSWNGGGNAKAMMQIDLDRKSAAYNAQQKWFSDIQRMLNEAGTKNKVK